VDVTATEGRLHCYTTVKIMSSVDYCLVKMSAPRNALENIKVSLVNLTSTSRAFLCRHAEQAQWYAEQAHWYGITIIKQCTFLAHLHHSPKGKPDLG